MRLTRAWSGACLRSALVSVGLIGGSAIAQTQQAQAQQATISGRVTAVNSGEPLADGRVMIVGTSLATTTGTDGRFVLRAVPAGNVEVRVLRVGFAEQKKTVAVAPGATVTLDFDMKQAVVQLQEIVTTATGEQRKVELGNALSVINAPKRVEETPISNISDLLVGKSPGVIINSPNMTGGAPVIRIRGLNSLSLSNAPIMIVDGVRFASSAVSGAVGGTNISMMNSISPDEIEDVEIVKGPSAATLYGTDAANGVIVITTKKGKSGAARWSWFVEPGIIDDHNKYQTTYALWGHNPTTNKLQRCQLATMGPSVCLPDSLTSLNIAMDPSVSPLAKGNNMNYGGQVSGGSDQVRYFMSADIFNETGPLKMPAFAQFYLVDTMRTALRDEWIHPEAFQRQNFRTNLTAAINPKLDISVNAGFSKVDQRLPQEDNNINGLGGAMYLTYGTNHAGLDYNPVGALGENLHGYARYTPATIFQEITEQGNQRITGSADAQWRPFSWMSNQGTVGIDLSDQTFFQICHFAECPVLGTNRLGFVENDHINNRNFSAKVVSNSKYNPRTWLNLVTTFGADYINTEADFSKSGGQGLPPGAQTVAAGATKTASDSLASASKTLGLYVQEQAGIRDRLFLTVAVRSDQNSAFGTQFQRVFYPKASLSWIMSDEAWFPRVPLMNSFRLRSAYGQSGVQPGSIDALRRFTASTVNFQGVNTAGLLENALGNPFLKPETSAEFEGGFDSRVWDNKVNVEFTYYRKQTKDALISLPIAPSAAPSATTVRTNLGGIRNSGLETQITAQLIDSRRFGWNVVLSGSHNTNTVLSLGVDPSGAPNKTIGTGASRDSVGFPVNALFVRPYKYADANGDGIIQTSEVQVDTGVVYRGYSSPRDLFSVQNGFDLFGRKLRLNVMMDYKGGFNVLNNDGSFICGQAPQSCVETQDKSMPLWRQARAVANNYGSTINGTKYTSTSGYYESGQFWRLREVSATIQAPQRVAAGLRARDANLTIGARNLHVWSNYTGVDPEGAYGTGDTQSYFLTTAPRTYFTFRLNLHY
ncbi:MAG: TonB-dependent outer membrane protein SusC/RagA [Gemmatimonadetes bacterium]|nr:TonB-dependent outer membrane protein SusC/RagA [Gemmatimonadota bacterium]